MPVRCEGCGAFHDPAPLTSTGIGQPIPGGKGFRFVGIDKGKRGETTCNPVLKELGYNTLPEIEKQPRCHAPWLQTEISFR